VDISETYDFTAPPEVVFNSLTDPDRAHRWLPSGVRAERPDGHGLRLLTAGPAFDLDTDADDLRVGWRSPDDPGLHAQARVVDGPAGGSRVRVTAAAPDGLVDEERARSMLAETMTQLQREVSDNFNAG
jgi:uncharacterized protein YndB with AHSA1/START domain